jgi:hypothetical protein
LPERRNCIFLCKNPIKEDRRRLHYTQGVVMPDLGKMCKWKGQFHVCISREFLDYNKFPLMCEVKRETDGRNTLQYIYQWDVMELRELETRVRERAICKTIIISLRQACPCLGCTNHGCQSSTLQIHVI